MDYSNYYIFGRRKESISDAYNSSDGFKKCFLYDWKMLNRKGRFVTFLKEMFNITVSSTEEVEKVDEKQTTLGKEDISTLKEISINSYEFLLNFYIQTLCEIPLATQLKSLTEDDIDEGKELELFKLPFGKF